MADYIIPTWKAGQWLFTEFETQETFRDFLVPLFKEPGLYNFDETVDVFLMERKKFLEHGVYCEYSESSRQYYNYWFIEEKEKCRRGVIYHNEKGDTWYLPGFFYQWLNFLMIYDKRKKAKKAAFPEFRDVQYHMSLYEYLAQIHDLNAATLKRRQVASTYIHDAILFNKYIFEEQFKGKIGASDEKYIKGGVGCWRYLDDYSNFTNTNTAWIRENNPGSLGLWIQRAKGYITDELGQRQEVWIGNQSSLSSVTFDKDPASGVGGAIDIFYYEEAGIASTLDQTYGYIREAQREGSEVTGYFTAAGSVGSLTQCEPLRELILYPEKNDIYPVKSTIKDELGEECLTGLFIPIYWGYVPFIDKWGNSQIAEAKDYVNKLYAKEKAKGDHGKYQLLISQGPRTIMEAFGVRTESIFELRYTAKQAQLIEDKTYWLWNCNLVRNLETGKVEAKEFPEGQKREPNVYPSPKTKQDKRGCVTIHEKPVPDAPWLTYYGSVDPVEKGGTSFSDSLAYCCIWKNVVEVHKTDANGKSQVFLEGGKLVAEYWGRFDDVNETNEMISMLVEYYNAWTICENNKNSWINHMRIKKRYRYLARKSDMLFDKEMKMTDMGGQEFGWTKTTAIWTKMLEYGLNSLSEVTYEEFDKNGDITKTHYGHERIPFINIIREMQAYNDKGNFDALVSYCALMAFIKIQQADKGIKKRIERSEESSYERNQKLMELSHNKQPFNNMGTQGTRGHYPASYNIIRRNAIKGRC